MEMTVDGTRPLVLVVDDEDVICRALDVLLRRAGYEVMAVQSGAAARNVLTTRAVDCLVLDFRIPDLRGDVVFAYAVAQQPHLARATVFVTGDISDRAREVIEETGCPLVLKPFDTTVFLERVAEQLASGQRP